jgi:transposase-like protein
MRTHDPIPDADALRARLAARLPVLALRGAGTGGDPLEERCRLYLHKLRWPAGVECPRCEESERLLWLEAREKWHCYSCRYQFSVTAGTLFHSSHLPLWKWFAAVELMTRSERGVSANELRRALGGSYKTFWFTAHRIRVAMRGRGEPLLRSVVGGLGETRELRRGAGPYRHLSEKYLTAYAEEQRWRERNRHNPHVFRDTILALARGEGVSYEQLVAAR